MKDVAEPQGGFAQLVGYRLTKWELDYAEVELDLEPRHLNRSGVPHGGVITTLIDTTGGFVGCYCAVPGRVRVNVLVSRSSDRNVKSSPFSSTTNP